MKEFVEYIEHINKDGVVTKRTADGVELPILTDKPSYCMLDKDINWAKIKKYLTLEEHNNLKQL